MYGTSNMDDSKFERAVSLRPLASPYSVSSPSASKSVFRKPGPLLPRAAHDQSPCPHENLASDVFACVFSLPLRVPLYI